MHETTQRFLCRLGFILACLLPTTVTAACIISRATPWYAARVCSQWERSLREHLGVQALVAEAEEVRPGAWLLSGIELTDPETNERIAIIRMIEAELIASDGERAPILRIHLSGPELQFAQAPRLWSSLERRILRSETDLPSILHITAGELTLLAESGAQTWTDLECFVETSVSRRGVECRLRLPTAAPKELVEFSLARRSEQGQSFSEFHLDSYSSHIPCQEFAAWLPWLAKLGPRSRFQGVIHAFDSPTGWQGEFSGQLTGIDLDRLVTDQFPHKLSGLGTVVVDRAVLEGGRIAQATGNFDARDGAMSASLLAAVEESMGLETSRRRSADHAPHIKYHQLSFDFDISPDGLEIAGDEEGVVCIDAAGPLLRDGGRRITPVASLVRALSPNSEILVPATAETDLLLRILPSAPMVTPRERVARPGYPGTKLDEGKY